MTQTYTDRVIQRIVSSAHSVKTGIWFEGKMYSGFADKSKSRAGVKYNKLIKLRARILRLR